MMKVITLVTLLLCVCLTQDEGARRIKQLRQLTYRSSDYIIRANSATFNEYATKSPRPYTIVLYFVAQSCRLCVSLDPDWKYLAQLYKISGAMDQAKNPVFFFEISYSQDTQAIFQLFDFNTAPNLAISKPKMAVINPKQIKGYLQSFKWAISNSDGHVTTHKMLEFANKRTGKQVNYKPPFTTMLLTMFGFIGVALAGVFIYTQLQVYWLRWPVWFFGSLIIYITCVSGVVYDIIHNVPFVGSDKDGNPVFFSGGNREQYGAEGLIISLIVTFIGVLFILILTCHKRLSGSSAARFISLGFLVIVVFFVKMVEQEYKKKAWYNPMFFPPGDYLKGSYTVDQGNNI